MVTSVPRHRRTRRIWLSVAAVCVLALTIGAVIVGYDRLKPEEACTGEAVRLTVAASIDQFSTMDKLAGGFNALGRRVSGHCTEVKIRPATPAAIASQLGANWNEDRDGPRPDVWVPDSSAWLLVAAARPEAKAILPAGAPPSVATSPVVLAMQRPMAEALGWPKQEIGLTDLLHTFGDFAPGVGKPGAGGSGGTGDGESDGDGKPDGTGTGHGETWARFGHADWGPLRLGMADPATSTAGLVSVLTILDPNNDGAMDNDELVDGLAFSQLVTATGEDTDSLLRPYSDNDTGQAAAKLPAALPVLERDLADYASKSPGVELVPVYLREGSTFADYPYTVLRAPWVNKDDRELADDFLEYLGTRQSQKTYAEAGFRDPSRSTQDTTLLNPDRGFQLEVTGPQRAPSQAELTELMGTWTALQRPNNALLALDTSGSMDERVPGTNFSRLQLIQQAAIQGATVLNDQTTVGLWQFSTRLSSDTDYRELVPPGKVNEKVGNVPRRQAVINAVQGLHASGDTGLYDTVYAAYLRMQQAWRPNAQNVVVVMTDGKNEDSSGLSLPELIKKLQSAARSDRPLPVIGIAVGPQADADALQQISKATGGRTVVARNEVSAIQQIVLAFAGRLEASSH